MEFEELLELSMKNKKRHTKGILATKGKEQREFKRRMRYEMACNADISNKRGREKYEAAKKRNIESGEYKTSEKRPPLFDELGF